MTDQMQSEIDDLRAALGKRVELTPDVRRALLVSEGLRWTGVREIGGDNRGQVVELFQKYAAIPPGRPWCMAFVQYCVHRVDVMARILGADSPSPMAFGAACLSVWDKSPDALKMKTPVLGSVVIWRHRETGAGHTAIVTHANPDGSFLTVEGNTSPGQGVNRDGDGIYEKAHRLEGGAVFEVVGFLVPWV